MVINEHQCVGALQESRRKAQEELAGATKAEKAAQKTIAALEKDLSAAVAKVTRRCP